MAEAFTVDAAAIFTMGRKVLAEQPFSRLIGAELLGLASGRCEMALTITDHLKQQMGFVHGGVLTYLADNALTFAGGTALGVPVVTAEYKINYLRPAVGERLIARAHAAHVGKSQSVCQCEIWVVTGGEERLCALAQGTIASLANSALDHAVAKTAARGRDTRESTSP